MNSTNWRWYSCLKTTLWVVIIIWIKPTQCSFFLVQPPDAFSASRWKKGCTTQSPGAPWLVLFRKATSPARVGHQKNRLVAFGCAMTSYADDWKAREKWWSFGAPPAELCSRVMKLLTLRSSMSVQTSPAETAPGGRGELLAKNPHSWTQSPDDSDPVSWGVPAVTSLP